MIYYTHNRIQAQRGFTLLIAIILASVTLVVGLALADVAYKQVVLSSTSRNSQVAFYRADSAMECALYYDQKFAAFNIGSTFDLGDIKCENRDVTFSPDGPETLDGGGIRITFDVTCPGGGSSATVDVYKEGTEMCSSSGLSGKNCFYASGYNTCSTSDPNRFERSLRVVY